MILNRIGTTKGDMSFNLAPLIDVMFQLIIFFMLTSNLNENYTIDIDPPSIENQNLAPAENRDAAINITKDNKFLFNQNEVGFDRLKTLLEVYYREKMKPITVMADKNSSLWPTMQLLNFCQEKRYKVQYLIADSAQSTAYSQKSK